MQAQVDICLEPSILLGATISIYIDMQFTWLENPSESLAMPSCTSPFAFKPVFTPQRGRHVRSSYAELPSENGI